MSKDRTLILTSQQVQQKLNRMAHEIHENHFEDKELVIIGIAERGSILAARIVNLLRKISDLKITTADLVLNKKAPEKIVNSSEIEDLKLDSKVVILVDDVLNSGKTLAFGVKHLLDYRIAKLCTVVMVNRRHRLYPVRADYVGLTLATTLKEHISVDLTKGFEGVYLE